MREWPPGRSPESTRNRRKIHPVTPRVPFPSFWTETTTKIRQHLRLWRARNTQNIGTKIAAAVQPFGPSNRKAAVCRPSLKHPERTKPPDNSTILTLQPDSSLNLEPGFFRHGGGQALCALGLYYTSVNPYIYMHGAKKSRFK